MENYKPNILSYLFTQKFIIIIFFLSSCSDNLPHSVTVLKGDVNGVVINRNGEKLIVYGNPQNLPLKADKLLLTHCRLDLLWAAKSIIESGTETYVPAKEFDYFSKVDSFWNNFNRLRYHDYDQQTTKYPALPLNVKNTLQGGDTFNWQDLQFQVINTPGYTRGAVSYICQIDKKKIALTGDLIYDDGQLFDLYSLQNKVKELEIRGYHGYASRIATLIKSLQDIESYKPDIIIPSRGPIIQNPENAIDKLIDRLRRLYSNYIATSAYRWYTGKEKQIALAQRVQLNDSSVNWMPLAETIDENLPWLKHINNSILITSKNGSAFLIDCGILDTYKKLIDPKGILSNPNINGIFVTHYHDDHTNYVPELVKKYNCPVYVTKELESILSNPGAYRLPAMTDKPITNIMVVPEGYEMQWNEFTFTFYNFPGQTIYHDAILVEHKNDKIFFIGDSFSPSGIDDYCLQNRNIIQNGKGYYYCINTLRKMPPEVWLLNQHIHKLFHFSPEQLNFMEQKLRERESILYELSPWEDINYFIDEQWSRIYPYSLDMKQGQDHKVSVIIKNYQNKTCNYRIRPNANSKSILFSPSEMEITVPPHTEGTASFMLSTSQIIETGIHVITTDISYNGKTFHEWCEGIIDIGPMVLK